MNNSAVSAASEIFPCERQNQLHGIASAACLQHVESFAFDLGAERLIVERPSVRICFKTLRSVWASNNTSIELAPARSKSASASTRVSYWGDPLQLLILSGRNRDSPELTSVRPSPESACRMPSHLNFLETFLCVEQGGTLRSPLITGPVLFAVTPR